MILQLKELYDKLKNIKTYLIKIGPKRRQGQIVINKLEEAKIFYDEYTLLISELNKDIKEGRLSTQDTDLVIKLSSDFQSLYTDIEFLCTKHKSSDFKDKLSDMTETNVNMVETFNLKTALSLLAQMNDDEFNTKQLIDNIEYYASVLEKDECKHKLIQFVLKSRLSQGAKLKIKCSYSTVTDLINDMRKELLPQKSAPAIQDKLQKCRQNNLNIQDYGKEITEMFVELTIAQSSGNSDCYNILKPLNEKYAIKKFANGLRNRRLSTVITSRNYSSLKDAIQAAMEEDIGSASTSAGEILAQTMPDSSANIDFTDDWSDQPKVVEAHIKPKDHIELVFIEKKKLNSIKQQNDVRFETKTFCYVPVRNSIYIKYMDSQSQITPAEFVRELDEACLKNGINELYFVMTKRNNVFVEKLLNEVQIYGSATMPRLCILKDIIRIENKDDQKCELSKYVEAYPLISKNTTEVARILVNNFILRYGIPKEIATDRGAEFMSSIMNEVCKLLHITKTNSTAYHHQSIGALENSHKHLGSFLRIQCDNHPEMWSQWLPFWCFSFNTSVHRETKFTPYELVFGKKCSLPSNLLANSMTLSSSAKSGDEWLVASRVVQPIVLVSISSSAELKFSSTWAALVRTGVSALLSLT
ncbi:hypothetical protein HF086_017660 [Spodoptera exigua]|uniref:Integrase catalytic domain-containing protein n=1 Tax=Spodoptera exigua TaxID=7107 RepID=A0A922MNM1_SPOEX|nr:hypothetical protein HF086_017660 [Spodoptera exigua]